MSRNPEQNIPQEFQNLFRNVVDQINHEIDLVGAYAPNGNPADSVHESEDTEM